jgi:hypothetical protein
VFADAVTSAGAGFERAGPGRWDRVVSPEVVWRFSFVHERDWPPSKGQMFVGVLAPELTNLLPSLFPPTMYGLHFGNLQGLQRLPLPRGWDETFDLVRPRRGGPFRRHVAPEEAVGDVRRMVADALAWLMPMTNRAGLIEAMRGDLNAPRAGHGGTRWTSLGALMWLEGDRSGAEQMWAAGEARSISLDSMREDHRLLRAALDHRDQGD